jgi:hypothetical protein
VWPCFFCAWSKKYFCIWSAFDWVKDPSFKVEKHEIISGIAVDFHGMSQVQTLHKALTDAFRISSALLIMIGAICSAVQYRDNKFYFFLLPFPRQFCFTLVVSWFFFESLIILMERSKINWNSTVWQTT